jgi:hypothetical protein
VVAKAGGIKAVGQVEPPIQIREAKQLPPVWEHWKKTKTETSSVTMFPNPFEGPLIGPTPTRMVKFPRKN